MIKSDQNEIIIPTYIINLKERKDRLKHIKYQFLDKLEFNVSIIEAVKHEMGAIGLWQSITKIVDLAQQQNEDFILICEDDHEFTSHYSKQHLFDCIAEAKANQADVLLGGVSSLRSALSVTKSLVWTERFSASQFIILFSKFFKPILASDFEDNDSADYKIGSLTVNKFFIYPFISVQKEFGYSDATVRNNEEGRVTELFDKASETVQHLKNVTAFYKKCQDNSVLENEQEIFDTITIPTYIINLPERTERREHIQKQFEEKKEFDVTIVEACKDEIGAVGLWHTMCKIVKMAIDNEDDVIIICEDDHEFATHYTKEYLLKNIFEAHEQGAAILSGGIGDFTHAIPLTGSRMWISSFLSTQFIVLYKKIFKKILQHKFKKDHVADMVLADMTSHKMVLYPFISRQKDFGYSDITAIHNTIPGLVQDMFKKTEARFEIIRKTSIKY